VQAHLVFSICDLQRIFVKSSVMLALVNTSGPCPHDICSWFVLKVICVQAVMCAVCWIANVNAAVLAGFC
jgi:hypothetical protein